MGSDEADRQHHQQAGEQSPQQERVGGEGGSGSGNGSENSAGSDR